tara:strand:- start:956 stop:1219 length:264 start_codon:yes stop_codon:yes gene_type:complete
MGFKEILREILEWAEYEVDFVATYVCVDMCGTVWVRNSKPFIHPEYSNEEFAIISNNMARKVTDSRMAIKLIQKSKTSNWEEMVWEL